MIGYHIVLFALGEELVIEGWGIESEGSGAMVKGTSQRYW